MSNRRAADYTALTVNQDQQERKRPSRRMCWIWLIIAGIIFLIVVGLAVGLGVGLTEGNQSDDADSATTAPSLEPGIIYNATDDTNSTYWKPTSGVSWQIELLYAFNDTSLDVEVFDIDLFDNTASTISALHHMGRKVICYFSAGSYEDFRPDSSSFSSSDYGKELQGWPGEYWLNTNSGNVRKIMMARLDLAVSKGCDGVDPDNIDGYDNVTGLKLTRATAIDYLSFLAREAHQRQLSIGLKNGGSIVNQTIDMMEWQVNEECEKYEECDLFQPFIAAGKPVFHIEYPTSTTKASSICNDTTTSGFSTILKKLDLDNWVQTC